MLFPHEFYLCSIILGLNSVAQLLPSSIIAIKIRFKASLYNFLIYNRHTFSFVLLLAKEAAELLLIAIMLAFKLL